MDLKQQQILHSPPRKVLKSARYPTNIMKRVTSRPIPVHGAIRKCRETDKLMRKQGSTSLKIDKKPPQGAMSHRNHREGLVGSHPTMNKFKREQEEEYAEKSKMLDHFSVDSSNYSPIIKNGLQSARFHLEPIMTPKNYPKRTKGILKSRSIGLHSPQSLNSPMGSFIGAGSTHNPTKKQKERLGKVSHNGLT